MRVGEVALSDGGLRALCGTARMAIIFPSFSPLGKLSFSPAAGAGFVASLPALSVASSL